MLDGLLWCPTPRPKRGGLRMRQAQALLLAALAARPATGRLGNRLRAWVASPRRRTPLRYAGARVLAT